MGDRKRAFCPNGKESWIDVTFKAIGLTRTIVSLSRHDLSRYKPKPMERRGDAHKLKCYFYNKPDHLKRDCLKLKNANGGKDKENGAPHHLSLVGDHPLLYQSSLIELSVVIRTDVTSRSVRTLLDCGATTTYLSRNFVKATNRRVVAHPSRQLRVQTGDGRTNTTSLKLVHVEMEVPSVPTPYTTFEVVYDLPDIVACILGMPFFKRSNRK
ncbi:TPA: hypothetical protein N0F65_005693 [Lagenidium giganteum]|uniref:Uncharacterized protein n=1 Tax=Lagenidium giganteum TaxID=4803 RepID=A0AAV2ZA39_9STRA|nr:TPA: hypothetical protein N0F65_005693 [Lagenidium giganteum]